MTVFCKSVIYIPKFALVFEECAYWEGVECLSVNSVE